MHNYAGKIVEVAVSLQPIRMRVSQLYDERGTAAKDFCKWMRDTKCGVEKMCLTSNVIRRQWRLLMRRALIF
jgi:hypothetical protein